MRVSDNEPKAPDNLLVFRSIKTNDYFIPAKFLTLDWASREVLFAVNDGLVILIPECELAYAYAFVNFHFDSLYLLISADVVKCWVKELSLRLEQRRCHPVGEAKLDSTKEVDVLSPE